MTHNEYNVHGEIIRPIYNFIKAIGYDGFIQMDGNCIKIDHEYFVDQNFMKVIDIESR